MSQSYRPDPQAVPQSRVRARRKPNRGVQHLLGERTEGAFAIQAPPQSFGDLGFASWRELLPWPLTRPRSRIRLVLLGVSVLLALLFQLVGWHPALVLGFLGLGAFALWRELRSPQRRAARILEEMEMEMQLGSSPTSLQDQLELALTADPDNDGARFLLACLLFEEGRFLSALLQLAPLRDHHPNVGEVVLLAAAAYSNLDLHQDVLRLLGTLDIDPDHPSMPAAAAMVRRAQRGSTHAPDEPPEGSGRGSPSQMLS